MDGTIIFVILAVVFVIGIFFAFALQEQRFGSGVKILSQTAGILRRYPKFFVPLLLCWCVYAPVILYLKFFFPWTNYEFYAQAIVLLLAIVALSFTLGISCMVVLEMIQQIESGEKPKLWRAFSITMSEDFPRALPILFLWSLIWFFISLVQVFTTRKNSGDQGEKFSAENAARTLAGYNADVSLSDVFFDSLKKGIRMAVFLILPAVAWEELWPTDAARRGLNILKVHLSVFAKGFILTDIASFIILFPAMLLLYVSAKGKIHLPDEVWFGIILYSAFAWSLTFFIEQIFGAQLYLWHLKWVKAVEDAKANNTTPPYFQQVPQPSIMDDVPEFVAIGDPAVKEE
jgi:hypothetical protein